MPGRGFTITDMTIDDLRPVFIAGNLLWGGFPDIISQWKADNLAEIFSNDMALSLVAHRGKKLAGFLIADRAENAGRLTATIRWIGILKKYQAMGVDAGLCRAFMAKASGRGFTRVLIHIDSNNSQLIELFKNFDFTIAGQTLMMEHYLPNR